jgi:hypothetical protein
MSKVLGSISSITKKQKKVDMKFNRDKIDFFQSGFYRIRLKTMGCTNLNQMIQRAFSKQYRISPLKEPSNFLFVLKSFTIFHYN